MIKLLKFIGEYKKYAILTPICVFGEVLMEILIPFIMGKMVDFGIIYGKGISYIIKIGLLMIFISAISLIFGIFSGKFSAKAAVGFAKNIRYNLFNKIQSFSFSNIDKFLTSSLLTRLTTDVTNVQNAFMMVIRLAVRAPFMLIGSMIMVIYTNPNLSIIFLFAIPVLAISLYIIINFAYPRYQAMLGMYDKINLNVEENLSGIRLVKAFAREEYEENKFKNIANLTRKIQVLAEKLIIFNMPIMQLVVYSCILAVLWFGGNMIIQSEMTIGELASFIVYIMQILMSLMMLSVIFIVLTISKASVNRIDEVLAEVSDIKDSDKDFNLNDGSAEFKDVCFSYTNRKDNLVLKNINFSISSGETLGIIGSTGSGKSTLVQLLPRFYDIFSGKLIIGGHEIKDYKLDTLRNNISMVLQNNTLFSGTIKENLLWGDESAKDDEIFEACKIAQAHDFILSFKDGYETQLGQNGVNLSGGQKQRICIARAILKKPKILIFDDSTSAVDTATEAKIREGLSAKLKDITKIVVAQRILSIKNADKIIVLNNGLIDGYGTHRELIISNKIYREIYSSQLAGFKE